MRKGICVICGKAEARFSCRACGAHVCDMCSKEGICDICRRGRQSKK